MAACTADRDAKDAKDETKPRRYQPVPGQQNDEAATTARTSSSALKNRAGYTALFGEEEPGSAAPKTLREQLASPEAVSASIDDDLKLISERRKARAARRAEQSTTTDHGGAAADESTTSANPFTGIGHKLELEAEGVHQSVNAFLKAQH